MNVLKKGVAVVAAGLVLTILFAVNVASAGSNIVRSKPVQANGFYADAKPENAIDGDTNTAWNSGTFHPAWWEADLRSSYTIDSINVKLDQTPPGMTVFQAWVYNGTDSMMVARWNGYTKTGTWLRRGFAEPLQNIDRVRICSEASPSWISFLEVVVIGEPSKKYPKFSNPL